jgi:tetratricopeptide (TPR) repeat protein
MAGKSKFISMLTRDPLQRAEQCLREGDKPKAAELFARGGDFERAAKLAIELGDERLAVECALRGALGETPDGYGGANALQAGELLVINGHHREAIGLFELAQAWRKAAESALKLHQPGRAARHYERARLWPDAALYYERAGLLNEAARVLELESKRLRQDNRHRQDGAAAEQLRGVEVRRVELLRKLGKAGEGADLLRDVQPTAQTVHLLEEAGKHQEAIEACLAIGDVPNAVRLLRKAPGIDRRLAAQVYLRCGQPLEAANLLAGLGLAREAAEAYEAGKDWAKAGSRWEAAQDQERAAHAYLRAARSRDAGRCFAAAGKPLLAAASYAKAGDRTAAAALYLKAGQPVPAAAELLAAGDRAGAAKALMEIPPGSPDLEEGTVQLAPLLVEEGLLDEALRRLRQLPPAAPGGDEAAAARSRERLYWEARALEGLGRAVEAESVYGRLLALGPEHRDAAGRRRELESRREAFAPTSLRRPPAPPEATGQPGAWEQPRQPGAAGAGAAWTGAAGREDGGAAGATTLAEGPRAAEARAWGPGNLAVGVILAGRYELLAELGRGGMGRVYKAHDREIGEAVAIKTLLGQPDDNPKEAERLLREVQICRKITHPNVVRVFDLGRFAGGIFITMELLEGERLDRLIDPARPLPLARVKSILGEVAAGLQEAHALGIVHRDLKPGNIILTANRLKILDFGIANMAGYDTRLTQTGFAVGSPMYMSPEQLQGVLVDGRSDLYALGVLAHALVAGQEPFDGPTAAAIAIKHLQQPVPDLRRMRPDLPPGWAELVGKLLAKRPSERYQTATEVSAALAALPV